MSASAARRASSPISIQDYLKSIFDKFGVHSRGQLVAEIFGSHYLPLMRGAGGRDSSAT